MGNYPFYPFLSGVLYFRFYCIFHRNFLESNSEDPDLTLHFAASKFLQCFHNTPNQVLGLKRTN